ncbi:hypothetical protein H8R18_08320 [Nanchangia anserum]|uniref:Uncharacterized protein n=1 Tax=Nanchangia anserum TaxID=2692125 RepID=A0A8I0G7Y6_9ACTO|nr:hypothetical protein [Nanchangia anserum]MBD3689522.1 hypothetical protein [Nanchangia anserum]QOX81712.1 hypothetical protein H8R18_08320 [Nanchangia anserum]
MNPTDPQLSSDKALESLLARTRADMTSRALGDMDRVTEDLNNLLYRVRGTRRTASAHTGGDAAASAAARSLRPLLAGADLQLLGVPASIAGLRPGSMDDLVEFITPSEALVAHPGTFSVVLGRIDTVTEAIQTATRLARRTPGPAHVVLGGAKTLTPGQGLRARSAEQLDEIAATYPDASLVLVVIDSPSTTHARSSENLAQAARAQRVWAVVSALEDPAHVDEWLWHLPAGLRATDLAVTEIWEADRPAAPLGLATPVGLLDLAPASRELWRLILSERLRRDGWRG